jgi:hypothetical protein
MAIFRSWRRCPGRWLTPCKKNNGLPEVTGDARPFPVTMPTGDANNERDMNLKNSAIADRTGDARQISVTKPASQSQQATQ